MARDESELSAGGCTLGRLYVKHAPHQVGPSPAAAGRRCVRGPRVTRFGVHRRCRLRHDLGPPRRAAAPTRRDTAAGSRGGAGPAPPAVRETRLGETPDASCRWPRAGAIARPPPRRRLSGADRPRSAAAGHSGTRAPTGRDAPPAPARRHAGRSPPTAPRSPTTQVRSDRARRVCPTRRGRVSRVASVPVRPCTDAAASAAKRGDGSASGSTASSSSSAKPSRASTRRTPGTIAVTRSSISSGDGSGAG